MKKTLIIIDAQNDFISGSLACEGAISKMNDLAYYLETKGNDYDTIIFTLDWHTKKHTSFVKNGGEWPEHCVQYSSGAAIYQSLLDKAPKNKEILFLTKGLDDSIEEYSIMKNEYSANIIKEVLDKNNGEINCCGIANEYCVLNTVKDLVDLGYGERIRILREYVAAVNDDKPLFEFAKENNLKIG
jgi:nicotinamidase/pyrazinamidase